MTTVQTQRSLRELDRRVNNGIEVTLLWSERNGALTVSVIDLRTSEAFELDAPRDCALDVFLHPYAYAARAGLRSAA